VLLQVQHHARHARLRFGQANLLEQGIAHPNDEDLPIRRLRARGNIEKDAVGVGKAILAILEVGGYFNRDAGNVAQRPEPNVLDLGRSRTGSGCGQAHTPSEQGRRGLPDESMPGWAPEALH
jgi:hypothetical protein